MNPLDSRQKHAGMTNLEHRHRIKLGRAAATWRTSVNSGQSFIINLFFLHL